MVARCQVQKGRGQPAGGGRFAACAAACCRNRCPALTGAPCPACVGPQAPLSPLDAPHTILCPLYRSPVVGSRADCNRPGAGTPSQPCASAFLALRSPSEPATACSAKVASSVCRSRAWGWGQGGRAGHKGCGQPARPQPVRTSARRTSDAAAVLGGRLGGVLNGRARGALGRRRHLLWRGAYRRGPGPTAVGRLGQTSRSAIRQWERTTHGRGAGSKRIRSACEARASCALVCAA